MATLSPEEVSAHVASDVVFAARPVCLRAGHGSAHRGQRDGCGATNAQIVSKDVIFVFDKSGSRTEAGWMVRLEVQASADSRRVMCHLPDGKWIELRKDAHGRWLAQTKVRGVYEVTLLDNGHNRTAMKVKVTK